MNKSNKTINNTTNYLDILPSEIIDRIFLYKTAFEIAIELKQARLFDMILEKESDELNTTEVQMRTLDRILEKEKMLCLRMTPDGAVNNADRFEYQKLDQIQDRVSTEVRSVSTEIISVLNKIIAIGESMEEIDTRFDAILAKINND